MSEKSPYPVAHGMSPLKHLPGDNELTTFGPPDIARIHLDDSKDWQGPNHKGALGLGEW